jgi:hypothetical protein
VIVTGGSGFFLYFSCTELGGIIPAACLGIFLWESITSRFYRPMVWHRGAPSTEKQSPVRSASPASALAENAKTGSVSSQSLARIVSQRDAYRTTA